MLRARLQAIGLLAVLLLGAQAPFASAQEAVTEDPDPTRLDVERLPPEAIAITRDVYAHGFFLEGMVGGRGFKGGVARVSDPGVFASIGLGYELLPWLMVKLAAEMSVHATDAPPPPSATSFQLMGGTFELRVQLPFSAFLAAWLGPEIGVMHATGNVLQNYGIEQAGGFDLFYGANLGLDWHMKNRHHSIGLMGGGRLCPSMQGYDGERSIGLHGAAYVRYVF